MSPLIAVSEDENKQQKSFPLRAYVLFRSIFDSLTGSSANFIINFLNFLYTRFRLVFILLQVTVEVIIDFATSIKNSSVKYMFWGRSPAYRWAVQIIAFGLIGAFGLLQVYRQPELTVSAQTVDVRSIAVAENDLIVETGSTQTLIPKSRGRLDTLTYTVQGGDTISSIAAQFGLSSNTILWSNGLSEGDYIKPGDELQIPEGDGVLHKVEKGDTLASIAKEYNSSAQSIAQVNWIDDPSQLPVGETIFVPNGEIKITTPVTVASTSSSSSSGYKPVTGGSSQANPSGVQMLWPIAGGAGTITQCPSWYHKAVDIASKSAPSIVAPRSGTVVFAGVSDPYGYGREIILDHGGGLYTQYAHLSSWAVTTAQSVSAGQVIGRMGSTGLSTGIHLHWEIRVGGSSYSHRTTSVGSYQSSVRSVCGY